MIELKHYRRPNQKVIQEIVQLILLLTGDWFTDNVSEEARRDLLFQDLMCLQLEGDIKSFIIFTSWEGSIYITLMGTHPEYRDQGLGTQLINYFIEHVRTLGYKQIMLLTVPSEVKPIYEHTIKFYEKHDFKITRRYTEIWGSGAIEMTRYL